MTSLVTVPWMASAWATSMQNPQFTAGEVLVHFRSGTPQGEAVARAAAAQPPNLDALRGLVDTLGNRVSVPLHLKSFGSGGWVVLAVDADGLAHELATRVRSRSGVASAEALTGESRTGSIGVRFGPGTSDATAVHSSITQGKADCLIPITRALERELGVHLAATVVAPDSLLLRVDLKALTLDLVQRLQRLAEAEGVQPNYTVKRFGS